MAKASIHNSGDSSSPPRRVSGDLRGRMRNFLMFLPNMLGLIGRLVKDSRVPTAEKALFGAAIVYVLIPIDFIPDFFPFIGQVDDIYLVALTLLRLVNRTDETVVREHWRGGGDIVALAEIIANLAPKFLPTRIARLITSKVEMVPGAQVLDTLAAGDRALVYESTDEPGADGEPRRKTAEGRR